MDILETVLLGVGTVFVGLVCLVVIIELMHRIVSRFAKPEEPAKPSAPAVPVAQTPDIDHNTLVVLAAAAIAEDLGKDVSAIRIHSIRKI